MTIFNKNIDIYLYSIYTKNDMQNAAFNNYTKKKDMWLYVVVVVVVVVVDLFLIRISLSIS